jgi:hypothetical protein
MRMPPEPISPLRAARAVDGDPSRTVLTITVRGEAHALAVGRIPFSERLVVRKATGLPFEAFLGEIEDGGANKIGLDTLIVLWWLARRAGGEWQLTLTRAEEEWPTDLDYDTELAVAVDEPDGATDPEV